MVAYLAQSVICRATYSDDYKQTVGVDFMEKVERIGSEDVKFMLWDTAGQDGFNPVTRAYYKGASAFVAVKDCQYKQQLWFCVFEPPLMHPCFIPASRCRGCCARLLHH
jgi:hypothetical protein